MYQDADGILTPIEKNNVYFFLYLLTYRLPRADVESSVE